MSARLNLYALLACGTLACARTAPEAAPEQRVDSVRTDASAGIRSAAFAALLEEHWAATMRASPEWALALGDLRHSDEVSDPSVAAAQAHQEATRAYLARAKALHGTTNGRDAVFLRLFVQQLEDHLAASACQTERWSLSPRDNPMASLWQDIDVFPLNNGRSAGALVDRVTAWRSAMDAHLVALEQGRSEGWVANATSLTLTIEMVRNQLDEPTASWSVASKGADLQGAWAADWPQRWEGVLQTQVRPGLEAYATYLQDVLLPEGRSDASPGLASLPDGQACYAAKVAAYTTLPLSASDLHQRGLDELAKIHAEFLALGPGTVGASTLPEIFDALRHDEALHFETAEQIVDKATEALARAQAAVPNWFGVLPETPCVVAEIPAFEAPYTTIAYYRQPGPGGAKPGEYFVNTYEPTTRPRFEAEVLAFHESVPGHHLQIARSYEQPEVPSFHRYAGSTVFVEGWALYTERLADEMGLYSSDVDRLGMLSFDAWRASRLVVDTGLHAKGWSREQAEQFMADNTPLAKNNIVNEVDRYITWPGQALAYKTGQLEIMRLRAIAEEALHDDFDLAAFHDVVLGQGAVTMPVLQDQVQHWMQSVKISRQP